MTKSLASLPPIKSYLRKKAFNPKFFEAVQELTRQTNVHNYNGKTFWYDENLRLDYGDNRPDSKEIHFNLQKNQASKLDGLKGVSSHAKIISLKILVEKELVPSQEQIEDTFLDPFSKSD